jgi:hypothetical protein
VREDEVREDEVKGNLVRKDEVRDDKVKGDWVREDEVREDEVKDDKVKGDWVREDEVREDEVKGNLVRKDEVRDDKVKGDWVREDEVKGNLVRKDEVRDDKVKGDWVRGDEVRENEVREDEAREKENLMTEDFFADIDTHLTYCTACQAEVAAYRLMLPVLETMPAAAFDFDVAEMVLANLPEKQVGISIGMIIVYCMLGAGVLTGLGALYVLTKFLTFNLVTGIGTIVIISVLILHLKEMIGQYQRQIRLLDHYQTN